MKIKLKNTNTYKKVIDVIAPVDINSEDQRNVYLTEDGNEYYPEDIEDIRF
jgi:hypothetical protein